MSFETTIIHAWQTQAKWLYLLTPLSWVYGGISNIRRLLYTQSILPSYKATVPVMVIGNITVGGSGKTPLIISLVKHLQAQGIEVGVISRGYGGDSNQMPALVNIDSTPDVVGDEPCLIVQSTAVAMSVCPNRQQAIDLLLKHKPTIKLIISDDGLQHYKLQRDIEWIVVDSHRGFGNQKLLPVGFLREPMSRLDGATVIYHQTLNTSQQHELFMRLQPDELQSMQTLLEPAIREMTQTYEYPYPLQVVTFPKPNNEVYAVSGIGYPKRFFDTLQALGYAVIEHPYPDHHDFSLKDLIEIAEKSANQAVIITSKDAVKIKQLILQKFKQMVTYQQSMEVLNELLARLFILPVTAKLSEGCLQALDKSLKQFNIVAHSKFGI